MVILGSLLSYFHFQVPSMVTCSSTVLYLRDVHIHSAFSSVARVTFLSPLNPIYLYLTLDGHVGLTRKSLTVTLLSIAKRHVPCQCYLPSIGWGTQNPSTTPSWVQGNWHHSKWGDHHVPFWFMIILFAFSYVV